MKRVVMIGVLAVLVGVGVWYGWSRSNTKHYTVSTPLGGNEYSFDYPSDATIDNSTLGMTIVSWRGNQILWIESGTTEAWGATPTEYMAKSKEHVAQNTDPSASSGEIATSFTTKTLGGQTVYFFDNQGALQSRVGTIFGPKQVLFVTYSDAGDDSAKTAEKIIGSIVFAR